MPSVGPKLLGTILYRPFRCLWMLEELGIPYQYEPVHPHSEIILKHNPLGKVPVLVEEDGFSMFESGAINTYLGDKYRSGKSKLVPWAGTKKRGVYEQTLSVLGTELDAQGLWIHRKHKDMGKFFTFVPDAVTHARKYFNKTNRSLMEQLRNNGPYLLGEDFTAVDIYWVHCLDWSQEIGWDDKWKDSASILEYLKICKSRPAYIKITEMKRAEQAAIRKRKAKAKKRSKL